MACRAIERLCQEPGRLRRELPWLREAGCKSSSFRADNFDRFTATSTSAT
jgi:hypothetical protein